MITPEEILESKKVFLQYIKETKLEGITPDWFEIYGIIQNLPLTLESYDNFDDIINNLGTILDENKDMYSVIHIDAWWYKDDKFLTLCSLSTK